MFSGFKHFKPDLVQKINRVCDCGWMSLVMVRSFHIGFLVLSCECEWTKFYADLKKTVLPSHYLHTFSFRLLIRNIWMVEWSKHDITKYLQGHFSVYISLICFFLASRSFLRIYFFDMFFSCIIMKFWTVSY